MNRPKNAQLETNFKKLSDIHDTELRSLFCDYLISEYGDTDSEAKGRISKAVSSVVPVLSTMTMNDFNAEHILEHQKNWNTQKSRKEYARFLLFLCEKSIITDSKIHRFTHFASLIKAGSLNERHLPYILADTDFDRYEKSDIYNVTEDRRKTAFKLYFCGFSQEHFLSENMYNVLNEEFLNVKYNPNHTPETRFGEALAFRIAAYSLGEKYLEHQFTSELFRKKIEDCQSLNDSARFSQQKTLLVIFTVLFRHNMIQDAELCSFLGKYNSDSSHILTTEKMLEIFSHGNLSDWEDCYYNRIDGVQHAWRYVLCSDAGKRKLLLEFTHTYQTNSWQGLNEFLSEFDMSLSNPMEKLSASTYTSQITYFSGRDLSSKIAGVITAFYLYVLREVDPDLFGDDMFMSAAFHTNGLGVAVAQGYSIVYHNPLDEVPPSDKWIICYQDNPGETIVKTQKVDFSGIECSVYREWCKSYVWHADIQMYGKIHALSKFRVCFNYLYHLKIGEAVSILTRKSADYSTITVGDAEALKNHILSSYENNRTQCGLIYDARNVIRHADAANLGTIETGVFYSLTHTLSSDYDNTHALTNQELNAVSAVMHRKAKENRLAAIYYSIFYIALETEFRGSQIVRLTTDCIQETAKKGEYVLVSRTKTSAGEYVEQPITTYVKREIEEILRLTEEYRQDCSDQSLKGLLFISPSSRKGVYKMISQSKFNSFFQQCCKEAGISLYSLENLRDTHMTKSEEYIVRQALSEIEQSILTGHSSSRTDTVHYVDTNIRNLLEAVHGVIIGNVDVNGKVVSEIEPSVAVPENEVSNGCGYCKSPVCKDFTYLDCMLCSDFVTTASRLPYFEEQLRTIDARISSNDVPHDKEDLVNIKLLLLHYIEKIMLIKKEAEANGINQCDNHI